MLQVLDGVAAPEDVHLRHDDAGSRRVNERLPQRVDVALGSPRADADLLEGGHHQLGGGVLVERL